MGVCSSALIYVFYQLFLWVKQNSPPFSLYKRSTILANQLTLVFSLSTLYLYSLPGSVLPKGLYNCEVVCADYKIIFPFSLYHSPAAIVPHSS